MVPLGPRRRPGYFFFLHFFPAVAAERFFFLHLFLLPATPWVPPPGGVSVVTPVPLSAAVMSLPEAARPAVRLPPLGPAVVGVKCTVTVQLAGAPTDAFRTSPQLVVPWEKLLPVTPRLVV